MIRAVVRRIQAAYAIADKKPNQPMARITNTTARTLLVVQSVLSCPKQLSSPLKTPLMAVRMMTTAA